MRFNLSHIMGCTTEKKLFCGRVALHHGLPCSCNRQDSRLPERHLGQRDRTAAGQNGLDCLVQILHADCVNARLVWVTALQQTTVDAGLWGFSRVD